MLFSCISHQTLLDSVTDTCDAVHLLQSFQNRKMSTSIVFLTYCSHFGRRRSQSWWCLVRVWNRAQVL